MSKCPHTPKCCKGYCWADKPPPSPECPTQEDLDLATVQAIRDEMRKTAAQAEPNAFDSNSNPITLSISNGAPEPREWTENPLREHGTWRQAFEALLLEHHALEAEREVLALEWNAETEKLKAERDELWNLSEAQRENENRISAELHKAVQDSHDLSAELTSREEKYGVTRLAIDKLQRDLVAARSELTELRLKVVTSITPPESSGIAQTLYEEVCAERDEARAAQNRAVETSSHFETQVQFLSAEVERLNRLHKIVAAESVLIDRENDRLKAALERAKLAIKQANYVSTMGCSGEVLKIIEALERGEGE